MADRETIGGFVLAGGKSSRMGRPKGLLTFAKKPLVVHVARVIAFACEEPIIIGPPGVYGRLGFRVVADDRRNCDSAANFNVRLEFDCGLRSAVSDARMAG